MVWFLPEGLQKSLTQFANPCDLRRLPIALRMEGVAAENVRINSQFGILSHSLMGPPERAHFPFSGLSGICLKRRGLDGRVSGRQLLFDGTVQVV